MSVPLGVLIAGIMLVFLMGYALGAVGTAVKYHLVGYGQDAQTPAPSAPAAAAGPLGPAAQAPSARGLEA